MAFGSDEKLVLVLYINVGNIHPAVIFVQLRQVRLHFACLAVVEVKSLVGAQQPVVLALFRNRIDADIGFLLADHRHGRYLPGFCPENEEALVFRTDKKLLVVEEFDQQDFRRRNVGNNKTEFFGLDVEHAKAVGACPEPEIAFAVFGNGFNLEDEALVLVSFEAIAGRIVAGKPVRGTEPQLPAARLEGSLEIRIPDSRGIIRSEIFKSLPVETIQAILRTKPEAAEAVLFDGGDRALGKPVQDGVVFKTIRTLAECKIQQRNNDNKV